MGGFSGTIEIGNQSSQRLPEASRIAIKTFDVSALCLSWSRALLCLMLACLSISGKIGQRHARERRKHLQARPQGQAADWKRLCIRILHKSTACSRRA